MKENENEQSEAIELAEDQLTVDRQSQLNNCAGSSRVHSRSSSTVKGFGSQLDVSSPKKNRNKCISENYDLNQLESIKQFIEQFDFKAMPVINALRRYMNWVPIHGEAHVVDQRMNIFSNKYCRDNEIDGLRGFHVLVCSIILLNTDLHISKYGVKMTKHEYINNTLKALTDSDYTPTASELATIYYSAKKKPLPKPISSKKENTAHTASNAPQQTTNVTYVSRGLRKTQTLFKSNTQLCVSNYSSNNNSSASNKFGSPSSLATNKADSCMTPTTASTNSESLPSFSIKKSSLSYGTIGVSGRMMGELCNDTLYENDDFINKNVNEDPGLLPLNMANSKSPSKSNKKSINSEASYDSALSNTKAQTNVNRFRLNSLRITSFKLTSGSKTSPTKASSELRGINMICKVKCYMIEFCDSLYSFYLTNIGKLSESGGGQVCESGGEDHMPLVEKKKDKRKKKGHIDEPENFCMDSFDLSSLRKCALDKHVNMEFSKTTLKLYKAVKSTRHGRPLMSMQMTQVYAERLTETSFYTEKTQCMLLEQNDCGGNGNNNLLKSKNLQKIIRHFKNSMILWDKDPNQSGYFFVFDTAQDRDEMLTNINLSNAVHSYVPLAVPSMNKPILHNMSYNTDLTITTLPRQYKKIANILEDFTKFYNNSRSYQPEESERSEYNKSTYIVLRQVHFV